jgi:hypothetical protein
MRILLGHQSVGENIIEGLRAASADVGAIVPIADVQRTKLPAGRAMLAHFRVGTNGAPQTKLQDFVRAVRARADDAVGLALFKFCYVDIVDEQAVERLFADYCGELEELQSRVGPTVIGHMTVPLRARPSGLRATLRHSLGRYDTELARNAARHGFNQHLRRRYGDGGTLFDLAAVEAARTGDNGSRPEVRDDETPALLAEYTNDGGHLNERGRTVVAQAFMRFLDEVRSRRDAG